MEWRIGCSCACVCCRVARRVAGAEAEQRFVPSVLLAACLSYAAPTERLDTLSNRGTLASRSVARGFGTCRALAGPLGFFVCPPPPKQCALLSASSFAEGRAVPVSGLRHVFGTTLGWPAGMAPELRFASAARAGFDSCVAP